MRMILFAIIRTTLIFSFLAWLLPNVEYIDWVSLLLASSLFALLSLMIKPLLTLVFLPIRFVTFGLFSWVIEVGMVYLTLFLIPGFSILPMKIYGVGFNLFFTLVLMASLIKLLNRLLKTILE